MAKRAPESSDGDPRAALVEKARTGLRIDKLSLDDELERQSEMFYAVAEAHSKAVSARDAAKDELKRVDAELYLVVRDDLTAKAQKRVAGGDAKKSASPERITEAQVNSEVILHTDHIKAEDVLRNREGTVNELEALRDAWHQRGYALKDLAALFVAQFFMRDSAEPKGGAAANMRYEATRERMSKAREEEPEREPPKRRRES